MAGAGRGEKRFRSAIRNPYVPPTAAASIATTARRKAIDRLRHLKIVEAKRSEMALALRLDQGAHGPQNEIEVSPIVMISCA